MSEYDDQPGRRPSYRVSEDPEDAAREGRRLALIGDLRDRRSARQLLRLGVREGWHCLDVGTGSGSLARWMAQQVGASGRVLATDVDLRFAGEATPPLELLRHDVVTDPLPEAAFDLVHARSLLQTLDQRERVLDDLVRAAKPGGWVVASDPEWAAFDRQPLPPAFRTLHEAMMAMGKNAHGYDRHWACRLPAAFRVRGLEEVDCLGSAYAMHGGTDSAEWLVLAYERAGPGLVESGLLDAAGVEAGLREARSPEFLALGPLSVLCWGRRPVSE